MTFRRNQEVIDPDGYISKVLLYSGEHVTVERLYAHKAPRYKTFKKSEWIE